MLKLSIIIDNNCNNKEKISSNLAKIMKDYRKEAEVNVENVLNLI